jgi:hypothetical protein
VSGLTLVGVVYIPGNILEGNWRQAVLVDERASDLARRLSSVVLAYSAAAAAV